MIFSFDKMFSENEGRNFLATSIRRIVFQSTQKFKIKIITTYVMSKLRWRLSIYNMREKCIVENLDNKITYYVRKWLHIPRSGNISYLQLSSNNLTIGLQLISDVYRFCKVTIRSILKN